ncbi:hypothetical protein Mgra_00006837 [Meloidogyne graminicola]|uniref:Uncharacterized protein n=1 Tax=Meloidogyne graminicola TaxID=189291 RepID=A0A8S9ZK94_9BILA|nr:hypothetical protein Mgra_00006837 [Meloidogyne graminicola]
MTENFSTPNLDKDNSFTYLSDSQKRFNEGSVSVGLSTPTSSISNLNPDEARNRIRNLLLQAKNERFKAEMNKSNKINDNQNKENYDLNISKSSNDFIIKKENDELISESKNKGEIAVYKKS